MNDNLNLKKTLVFHLNKIGSLIIYILLPEQLKDNPKQMKFLHKCENNQLIIKIKDANGQILVDYTYNFSDDNSFSVINIKNTLPKIISLSPQQNANSNNNIKYLVINYSITKSAINDYYFADKILNYDTSYDYLEKIIKKKIEKNFKKLKTKNIFCRNCGNNLQLPQKEIIHDYDSVRIEQNLEEFFNCQNNYNSFMKNKDATQGIANLKKVYEVKYNLDNEFLWIFNSKLNIDEQEEKDNKIEFVFCDKCRQVIGIKEEYSNISFNKLFLNLINMELIIDENSSIQNSITNVVDIVNVTNFFSVDYLHVLLSDSIKKGNKFLKFINVKKQLEIIFETKINILGLIDKNCNANEETKFLIDNYVNMFEVNWGQISKNDMSNYENNFNYKENIILNENDFALLENIVQENIRYYFSELFFYKLLTKENKKIYCFSIPKKK